MPLVAYLDESYNSERFFLGSAIAPAETWNTVDQRLIQLRDIQVELHGISPEAELHAHEILGGKGEWKPLRGKHREANQIIKLALSILQEEQVKFIFRGVDVTRLNARYKYPRPPHAVALQHTLERINEHAKRLGETEPVLLYADIVDTKEELQAQFAGYKENRTDGYRPSNLEHLQQPIRFLDSRLSPGLQAVDIGIYLYRRFECIPVEKNANAQRARKPLENLLQEMTVHRHTWLP